MNRIVLAGGGTGGHIMPNLALIPHLTPHFEVHYMGLEKDKDIVCRHSPQTLFHAIESVKLIRPVYNLKNLFIPFKLLSCKNATVQILKEINPSVVFSKGGFVALPTVLAAEKLKIPYILHESDYSLGVTNKLCKNKAKYVLGAFETAVHGLKNGEHVGAPLRNLQGDKTRLDLSNFDKTKPNLLVVGGSSGAAAVNKCIIQSLDILLKNYNVIHIVGTSGIDNTKMRGYLQLDFAHNIGDYIDAADVVVSRAGANALFELVSLHKPTIAIPLPKTTSRGDQIQNAKYFEDKNCIMVLDQDSLNQNTLMNKLSELEKTKQKLINNCMAQKNIDGTMRIVDRILSCVN